jgi:hypothetical protein
MWKRNNRIKFCEKIKQVRETIKKKIAHLKVPLHVVFFFGGANLIKYPIYLFFFFFLLL